MHEPFVRLAIAQASGAADAEALGEVLAAAIALDQVEAGFAERINASKARRGEAPTRLSRATHAEVDQYAADAAAMEAEQLRTFAELGDATGIVRALHAAMLNDVRFWVKADTKAHPDDAPLVRGFAAAKARFRDAMAAYLKRPAT